jgi:hypothetical protein
MQEAATTSRLRSAFDEGVLAGRVFADIIRPPHFGGMAMKRLVMMVLVALAIGSCGHREQPVYDVDNPLPLSAQSLSSAQIESRIIEGGAFNQWQFRRVGEGHLVAVHTQPKFSATVDVYFDRQRYKIVKQSTVGFRDTGTTIHEHYNVWIRNLEKGIDIRLAAPPTS